MALPSSGQIGISDIRTELGSSSGSLRTLSAAAGKSSPDAMSEFYSYTSYNPTDHFAQGTYSGISNGNQSISTGFSPDFVWIKGRSHYRRHLLYTSVGGTYFLQSNSHSGKVLLSNGLISYNSNSFTVGTACADTGCSGYTYDYWAWKGGSSTVTNTDGNVSISLSANPTGGFSTGYFYNPSVNSTYTVGHGLGATPKFVLMKHWNGNNGWYAYMAGGTNNNEAMLLNATSAKFTSTGIWGSGHTNSVITFKSGNIGLRGDYYMMYAWADTPGQKIGTYTSSGTNNLDVNVGFYPRFVLIRPTTSGQWWMFNRADITTDYDGYYRANHQDGLNTIISAINFTSTGFRLVAHSNGLNNNGVTYCYMALA